MSQKTTTTIALPTYAQVLQAQRQLHQHQKELSADQAELKNRELELLREQDLLYSLSNYMVLSGKYADEIETEREREFTAQETHNGKIAIFEDGQATGANMIYSVKPCSEEPAASTGFVVFKTVPSLNASIIYSLEDETTIPEIRFETSSDPINGSWTPAMMQQHIFNMAKKPDLRGKQCNS